MFKKSIAALAVLGAFAAGSAVAADVTIYGRADLGLRFTSVDSDMAGVDDVDTFEMATGNYTGNRVGIKGQEELGNGMTVAFVLENGFDVDTGDLGESGKIFDREATLQLKGAFGTIGMGRSTILAADSGSFGIGGAFSAFGTGWGDVGNQHLLWGAGYSSRADNMLTYVTPEFAGFKVYAQYSFGNGDGDENKSNIERYYGIGATYKNGALDLAMVVDSINAATVKYNEDGDRTGVKGNPEDTVRVIAGGSYDFGVVKPYLSAAYFKDGKVGDLLGAHENAGLDDGLGWYYDGWAVMLGTDVPAFGGTFKASLGYMDAEFQATEDREEQAGDQNDITRWMVGLGYSYPLSKRTVVYADAGYFKDDVDAGGETYDRKPSAYQCAVGLVHMF